MLETVVMCIIIWYIILFLRFRFTLTGIDLTIVVCASCTFRSIAREVYLNCFEGAIVFAPTPLFGGKGLSIPIWYLVYPLPMVQRCMCQSCYLVLKELELLVGVD